MNNCIHKLISLIFIFLNSPLVYCNNDGGVYFIENKGQVADQEGKPRPDILYSGFTGNTTFHLKKSGISYQFSTVTEWRDAKDKLQHQVKEPVSMTIYRVDLSWRGANSNVTLDASAQLPGYSNYYCVGSPQGVSHVKSYQNVEYSEIYEGINLHYYSAGGQLKYDLLVAAGANYKQIQLEISGAEQITLNRDGSVSLYTPLGIIQEGAPVVYQENRKLIASWKIDGSVLSFDIKGCDPTKPLIIDPVVRSWGTWYGGTGDDYINGCATDDAGNSYISGRTGSTSGVVIATSGSHQSTTGTSSWVGSFLVKFNNAGQRLWGTYYGPGAYEGAGACAVNSQGEIYLCGSTYSANNNTLIATPGSHQPAPAGTYYSEAYLAKFDSNGLRIWGTYYGGALDDVARWVALDQVGNVYMGGTTESTAGIATPGSHQPNYQGGNQTNGDAFLVKFNSAGVRQWATYYGNSGEEGVCCIAFDPTSNVIISGYTNSGISIASSGAHQTSFGGGVLYNNWDGFVAKFDPNGVRQWGTYYGGSNGDMAYGCVADAAGNIYVSGVTSSSNNVSIATAGAHQSVFTPTAGSAAFLVKFNSSGARQWGTYYGGDKYTYGLASAMNSAGDIYIAGFTAATGSTMATPGAHQLVSGGSEDGLLALFDQNGVLKESTFYGGINNQLFQVCATNTLGEVYCAGYSSTCPGTAVATTGSHQSSYGGGLDGIFIKFVQCNEAPATPIDATDHSKQRCEGEPVVLLVNSTGEVSWYETATSATVIATGTSYTVGTLGAGSYSWYVSAKTCNEVSQRVAITVSVSACLGISENKNSEFCILYPNPGDGNYFVECQFPMSVQLFSASGQQLFEENFSSGKHSLNLNDFSTGIYFVQLTTNDSMKFIKLVKQ